jgi:signal transduction histidine kinase
MESGVLTVVDGISGSIRKLARSESSERRRDPPTQAELEARIRRAAREWQEAFDAIESPVLVLGWSGDIQRLNRAALNLLGGAFDDWIARSLPSADEQPWSSIAGLVDRVKETGESSAFQIVEEEGRSWHVVANLALSPGPLNPARIVLSLRDVSDLVRLERSLRRSEKFSALGQLLGGVAHEARNPLFGISATVDALEGSGNPTEFLPLLRREVQRLQRLMDDLLEYGKPSSGLRKARVAEVIERAVVSFRGLHGDRDGPPVAVDLPLNLPKIPMDPERLERVFLNLLSNARSHSPPAAEIRIRGRIETGGGRAWVVCEVEDSGPGFREEDLGRIWEPFYSRRPGGTGLGLSIVQRIVEEHGGSVAAENHSGGGARIRLRFPTRALDPSGEEL